MVNRPGPAANEELPSISIIIPVYNGEASIAGLCDKLAANLERVSFEIILVNDDSPDNSHQVCMGIHKKHKGLVKYIRLAKNKGEHNAVLAGLHFMENDYAVIMDDDFQNSPDDVLMLLAYIHLNELDVLYTYYDEKMHSLFRNLGSKFNDFLATRMLGKPKDLYLCSFKLISKATVKEIIKYTGPYPYIDGLILRVTRNIGTHLVKHHPRTRGRSSYTLHKLISLWLNMFTNFSILPLRVSVILGFILCGLGAVLGAYSVYEKLFLKLEIGGWTSLMLAVVIFSGMQLIILGMVGEYLGRVFLSINGTPQFTIREIHK